MSYRDLDSQIEKLLVMQLNAAEYRAKNYLEQYRAELVRINKLKLTLDAVKGGKWISLK